MNDLRELRETIEADSKRRQAKATADVALQLLLAVAIILYVITFGGTPC